jgi:hypothetical protein
MCAQKIESADFFSIPWLKEVSWSEIKNMKTAYETLASSRMK